jgi:protein SCO1/2
MNPMILSLLFFFPPTAPEGAVPAPDLQDVGFDQRLNQPLPLELTFTDETGTPVKLGDYFTDRPVILVLVYYRCPMLCTLVLNGLVNAMKTTPLTLGKDYRVVTVSFDPRETWQLAAAKRENYLVQYDQPGGGEGWHFLTGKPESINPLTTATGFRYVYDAEKDQYLHASGIVVATPGGKISRYLYGIEFPSRDLRLALVEASENKIGSPVDQVLLYCFHYDPAAGKYTATVMNFVRAGGVLTFAAVIGLVWFLRRHTRGCNHRLPASPDAAPEPPPTSSADRPSGGGR